MNHATSTVAARVLTRERDGWRDVVFSISEARRALPYIAMLAADATDAFRVVQQSREALGQIAVIADRQRKRDVCEQRDRAIHRLNRAIDDCNAVGAHLIDLTSGQVSLPCLIEDRPACLMWMLGDDVAGAWSDLA